MTADEKTVVTEAFQKPLAQFLKGEAVQWGTEGDLQIRTLKQDGRIVIEDDERLQEGLKLWNALGQVSVPRRPRESKL